ncbi:MAG: hypothetical protein ACYS1A_08395 [Planctomycetota bacterium]|jgi:hypothetical protein
MMPVTEIQKGYRSYFIIGAQDDWDVVTAPGNMKQTVYVFVSGGLRNMSDPITSEVFTGNPSPIKQIENLVRAEGSFQLRLHADDMLFFIAHLLMLETGDLTSTDFTAQVVRASAAYASPLSLDTQPSATSPASDPGKLTCTFDANPKTGTIIIVGTDQNNQAITETLQFTASLTETTTKYFQTVDASGITLTDITGDNLAITCDKNTYTHVISSGIGDSVTEGFTMEFVKGEIPSTYLGCLIDQGTIEISDVINLTMNILSKRGYNRYNVDDVSQGNPASETPTDVSAYVDVTDEIFPAWGAALEIDDVQIPIESSSFSFNNRLIYPTRYRAVRSGVKPVRGGNRELTATARIDYNALGLTTNDDFDQKFEFDSQVSSKIYFIRKPYEGPEYTFEMFFPRCQLGQFPDPEVSEYPQTMQDLILRPIRPLAATYSDEIRVTIISPEDGSDIFP